MQPPMRPGFPPRQGKPGVFPRTRNGFSRRGQASPINALFKYGSATPPRVRDQWLGISRLNIEAIVAMPLSSRTRRNPKLLGGLPAAQPPSRVSNEVRHIAAVFTFDDSHPAINGRSASGLALYIKRLPDKAGVRPFPDISR